MYLLTHKPQYIPWNKGKLIGQEKGVSTLFELTE